MSEPENATPTPPSSKDPKVIKRYTNRKLYDTVESRYVTLDEISEMVKQGVEVQIVDNKSKEDLTSVTLAQIIFEEEKKKNRMPLSVLREIIRHPGDSISEFITREVSPRVASLREEAESRLNKVLRREEEEAAERSGAAAAIDAGGTEGAAAATPAATTAAAVASAQERAAEAARTPQRVLEEWQRRLDERVRHAMENVTGNLPAFGRDLQQLIERLETLEKRLAALEERGEKKQ